MILKLNPIALNTISTCFIISNPSNRIAIFHRCDNYVATIGEGQEWEKISGWDGISGSNERQNPQQNALQILEQETNIFDRSVIVEEGLRLDVPCNHDEFHEQIHPFAVRVSDEDMDCLALKQERKYDAMQLVAVQDFVQSSSSDIVPGLIQAFHHATYGKFDATISKEVRNWAADKENGASIMARNAIQLVNQCRTIEKRVATAQQIAMLRPSMVPIVNLMNQIKEDVSSPDLLESLDQEIHKCVTLAQEAIRELMVQKQQQQQIQTTDVAKAFTIATISRSGTLAKILKPLIDNNNNNVRVVCSQSTPGNEGELMARDLNVDWIPDDDMQKLLRQTKNVDLLLVGADCVLPLQESFTNKIGTKHLCEIAKSNEIPVYCCADIWKLWIEKHPPPIEQDLFEIVPLDLITKLLVPPPPYQSDAWNNVLKQYN